jgi:heptosyltransferase II
MRANNLKNFKTPKCKNFSGYKPCFPYKYCFEDGCQDTGSKSQTGVKILIISLDALGNVLDNTPILHSIKRKFPVSTIYWITLKNAEKILYKNHLIDKLFLWDDESRMILKNIKFDYLFNADKSVYACAFANEIKAKNKFGFLLNEDGKIIPANKSAMYSYKLGLNDKMKFRTNKKTGLEINHQVFDLKYKKDNYIFNFDEEELKYINGYKKNIKFDKNKFYIGLNTGCSNLFPNKKMTVEQHIDLIKRLLRHKEIIIVILGGKEDIERNNRIYDAFKVHEKKRIIKTPMTEGIRRGACYMSICNIVVSGDSFGMHLAIALQKYVIVWFGLSCWSEIELYGRGEKLIPKDLECAPCWNKKCPFDLECIKSIDLSKMEIIILEYIKNNK